MRPERSFVNCMDAADLRIAAPGRLGPPRLRNALAVQARNPKRPRRAPPPILDETALGRSGEESALHGACSRFRFALQTPIYTRCAPAATPHPSQARSEERGARSEERGARSGERGAGRHGEEWALRGVCSRFKFALAVPIQTPCSIATSPRSSQATPAGLHALVALTPRLRPRPPMRPRPSNPRALRMASGSMAMG